VRVSAGGPPSGVVTFLFTDIEGSTRRWEADAEAMRAALSKHDQVLRRAIEEHDGFVFSHTGDGVAAAFASPRFAVDAAIKAQLALELPVRMGIATGEAELRDGDYFGTVLNRAARVMAAGHGGQILVAESTAGLLSGVDLLDLGPRRLRDLPNPMTMFQIQAPGLRAEFPPLRGVDSNPGNLRPASTTLIGRETELSDVQAAVRAHRLVTLTGVGGVGKTRLALEVATGLADEFPDGVWVFELAAVTDPATVPDAVAAALGITQQPGRTVSESVAAAQEGRLRLLLIDNCEHVLDAAADLIEAIFTFSATTRVLATSREALGLPYEHLCPVGALDVDREIDSPAVALFAERAGAVTPQFSSAKDAGVVVEICRRLDGIPLAIELAAARMSSMTAREVRDRLDHRFRLLVGSRRGLARHQTLRHAVAWSYEQLEEKEKRLLQRCSVFVGGFNLESAYRVAGFDESDDYAVLDLLDALVRKSLLVADRSAERTRFSMLETIREFAEEELTASGAAEDIRAAHARHFADCEAEVLGVWDSPRQLDAYLWFTAELPNLRTAFRWAADRHELDAAATIATYAGLLGWMIEIYEPISWVEELIEGARAANHPRLAFMYVIAAQCYTFGRIEAAVRYCDLGAAVVESGRGQIPFGVQGMLYSPYVYYGRADLAAEWCRTQMEAGRDSHTLITTGLIVCLAVAGSHDQALELVDGVIEAAETTRNPYALSYALLACAIALFYTDPTRALELNRRGLELAERTGNRGNTTYLLSMVARLEARHGDGLAALRFVGRAVRNYQDSGNPTNMATALGVAAIVFDSMGRYESAAVAAGFGNIPLNAAAMPELGTAITHLRAMLGSSTYESLARRGQGLTLAEIAAFAYDQIDQAQAEFNSISK
jgi:predicted ATPase/class 3 adenylate cyclase